MYTPAMPRDAIADLVQRVVGAELAPVFIIGSGLAMPLVPGTEEMLRLIAEEYARAHHVDADAFLSEIPTEGNRYQHAFQLLLTRCGPDSANAVIRRAVLNAQSDVADPDLVSAAAAGDPAACEDLVNQDDSWRLNDGLNSFGRISTQLANPQCWVLTTNFDPLIDVAVRRAGGTVRPITFAEDGSIGTVRQSPGDVVVVHVHGDWYSADTLHTPEVLTSKRPRLKASLRKLMEGRLIVVIGYAGWEDIITLALDDLINEPHSKFDLRWAFREADLEEVEQRYPSLLQRLQPVLHRRAFLHFGVDAHRFLAALEEELNQRPRSIPSRGGPSKTVQTAKDEDEKMLRHVREFVVRWRGQYAVQVEKLSRAAASASDWRNAAPALSQEVINVITLAGAVARDLESFRIDRLEFAESYGLSIHKTVFWGQATHTALHQARLIESETFQALVADSRAREESGLPAHNLLLPDKYGFELIARVLNAGVELATYDISKLPRGFVEARSKPVPRRVTDNRPLILAEISGEPGLQLISLGTGMERRGSFLARRLGVRALCAQVNLEGSVDAAASDDHHLYYWMRSSQTPTGQFPILTHILDAQFLSPRPGAPLASVDYNGAVHVRTPQGESEKTNAPGKLNLQDALLSIDPLDPEVWHAIAVTRDCDLISGEKGDYTAQRSQASLWQGEGFGPELGAPVFWTSNCSLTLGMFQGLSCLIVNRQAHGGAGIQFLDPQTLKDLRRPLPIKEFVGSVSIASGRWLVASLLDGGEPGERIAVWDLFAADNGPIGKWATIRGDFHPAVVVAEDSTSFETVHTCYLFDSPPGSSYRVCRFRWPSGEVEMLESFSHLRIIPVTKAH